MSALSRRATIWPTMTGLVIQGSNPNGTHVFDFVDVVS